MAISATPEGAALMAGVESTSVKQPACAAFVAIH